MKPKKKRKVVKPKPNTAPPQRWTEGMSTMDGQKCKGWSNVTNWH